MVRFHWGKTVAATVAGAAIGILGLVVLLVGLAALTSECNDMLNRPSSNDLNSGGPNNALREALKQVGSRSSLQSVSCGAVFQYAWWTAALEFVALHAPLVELFSPRFKMGSVALLAVAVVLLMNHAHAFLIFAREAGPSSSLLGSSTLRKKAHVAFAGAVITSIANFYLICLMGWSFHGAATPPSSGHGKGREAVHTGNARSHPLAVKAASQQQTGATENEV